MYNNENMTYILLEVEESGHDEQIFSFGGRSKFILYLYVISQFAFRFYYRFDLLYTLYHYIFRVGGPCHLCCCWRCHDRLYLYVAASVRI